MRSLLGILGGRLATSLVLAAGFAAAGAAPHSVRVLEDRVFFFRAQDGTVLALLMLDFLAAREGVEAYAAAARVGEVPRKGGSSRTSPRGPSPWSRRGGGRPRSTAAPTFNPGEATQSGTA